MYIFEILTNIQRNIGRRFLAKSTQLNKFERLITFKAARKIGIVYNKPDMIKEHLKKIIHHFESEGKAIYTRLCRRKRYQ